jgi:hypothetical protein
MPHHFHKNAVRRNLAPADGMIFSEAGNADGADGDLALAIFPNPYTRCSSLSQENSHLFFGVPIKEY